MFQTGMAQSGMAQSGERLLLLIDDEPAQCRLIAAICARHGWRVLTAANGKSALAMLAEPEGIGLDAVVLDQWVPGDDACALIAQIKARRPALPLIMLTTSASPTLAVEAMRAGACDYLVKPVASDRLLDALERACSRRGEGTQLQPLSEKLSAPLDFEAMVGADPAFRTALARAAKAARGQGNVLVQGEPGTGKETVIRAMHAASLRARMPLRVLSLANYPPALMESALFGHEPDAFPGAFDRQLGAMQQCDGASLMIDEIDRLSPELQQRLLDALKTGVVRPAGAAHGFRVDVRLFCASDRPIEELVARGQFDGELLALLGSVTITLPPLRERSGDISSLARHFLARFASLPGLRHLAISDGALALLCAYDWPGNIRQLQSTLFRATVHCDNRSLTEEDFSQLSELIGPLGTAADPPIASEAAGVMLYTEDGNLRPLEEIEADVIRLAIGHYRGRMTEVARRLGIGRSTLYRKLSTLGIDDVA